MPIKSTKLTNKEINTFLHTRCFFQKQNNLEHLQYLLFLSITGKSNSLSEQVLHNIKKSLIKSIPRLGKVNEFQNSDSSFEETIIPNFDLDDCLKQVCMSLRCPSTAWNIHSFINSAVKPLCL